MQTRRPGADPPKNEVGTIAVISPSGLGPSIIRVSAGNSYRIAAKMYSIYGPLCSFMTRIMMFIGNIARALRLARS